MTPEDRLRQAIEARASRVEPSPDGLSRIEEKLMEAQRSDNRKRLLLGLGAAAAIVAVVLGVVAFTDDDEPVTAIDDTTSSTSTSSTTSTTASTTTTTTFQGVDPAVPIFPDPTTSQRFSDPESAVREFADFVGFTHPVFSEFKQGDSASGEIEVQSFAQGAPTVVFVRQLEDDAWWVIGASADAIRLSTPAPGAAISSPEALTGQAYAYEGNVLVRLFVDGVQEPIAQTNVTGRGDGVLGDFSGSLEFTNATGATHGVLVLNGTSGEDGGPTELAAIRVLL